MARAPHPTPTILGAANPFPRLFGALFQSGDCLCSGLPLLAGLGQIGSSVFPFRRLPLQVGVGHRAVLPAEEFGPQDADLIGGVEGEPNPVPLTLFCLFRVTFGSSSI